MPPGRLRYDYGFRDRILSPETPENIPFSRRFARPEGCPLRPPTTPAIRLRYDYGRRKKQTPKISPKIGSAFYRSQKTGCRDAPGLPLTDRAARPTAPSPPGLWPARGSPPGDRDSRGVSSKILSCARKASTAFGRNARPASVNCVRPHLLASRYNPALQQTVSRGPSRPRTPGPSHSTSTPRRDAPPACCSAPRPPQQRSAGTSCFICSWSDMGLLPPENRGTHPSSGARGAFRGSGFFSPWKRKKSVRRPVSVASLQRPVKIDPRKHHLCIPCARCPLAGLPQSGVAMPHIPSGRTHGMDNIRDAGWSAGRDRPLRRNSPSRAHCAQAGSTKAAGTSAAERVALKRLSTGTRNRFWRGRLPEPAMGLLHRNRARSVSMAVNIRSGRSRKLRKPWRLQLCNKRAIPASSGPGPLPSPAHLPASVQGSITAIPQFSKSAPLQVATAASRARGGDGGDLAVHLQDRAAQGTVRSSDRRIGPGSGAVEGHLRSPHAPQHRPRQRGGRGTGRRAG